MNQLLGNNVYRARGADRAELGEGAGAANLRAETIHMAVSTLFVTTASTETLNGTILGVVQLCV